MPLWKFHLSNAALSADERRKLAEDITKIYTSVGMPAFYVQVRFETADSDTHFVGSAIPSGYVTIEILHIARKFDSMKMKKRFLAAADKVLTPMFREKGFHWEYFVLEGELELWKINGVHPPAQGTEMERKWREKNAPVIEDHDAAKL